MDPVTPGHDLEGRNFSDGPPAIRLALLTNMIAPYRVPLYNALARRFSLHLLYSGREDNRSEWDGTEHQLRGVHVKHSAGVVLKSFAPRSGQAYDDRYLHINPGYLMDLVRVRPHAVISAELGFRTLCAQVYCALAGVPLWVWWEGSIVTERDIGGVRKAVRRFIARHADRWISAGVNATRYLLTLGVPVDRIVHGQNCVDERQFSGVTIAPKELGPRPVLLVVSRLVPGKGIRLLLDVVAELRREGCKFSVVIVGDGSERKELEDRAHQLGLDNVQFHLARAPSEMPAYYRGADMLVFPTLHDVWGLVVNEALWSGLPVLASKYAGCADELLPADQIFDPLDSDEFARKVRKAITAGLPAVDTSALMPVQQVADRISDSIEQLVRPSTYSEDRVPPTW